MPTPLELHEQWLANPSLDEETRAELARIAGNEQEIASRFGGALSFGTGGLRGVIGAGTNRMNRYVVAQVTQGLADHLLASGPAAREAGAAIAYDSRRKSREFALETASVLTGNGIRTYLFDGVRPTPALSYAVRRLRSAGGVAITASHNPPEYNGYKVYGPDGGQILPDEAGSIAKMADAVQDGGIRRLPLGEAERRGLLSSLGEDMDAAYLGEIVDLTRRTLAGAMPGELTGRGLRVLYTPLHGAGYRLIPAVLNELDLCRLSLLPEQMRPDGNFPTAPSPNPEDPAAFAAAFARAEAEPADLILATDPDGDRLGVAENAPGGYSLFNGNEIGALLTDFVLASAAASGQDLRRMGIVKTIVTTEMIRGIAGAYGVEVLDTLTGFKYIGAKIGALLALGRVFLFGAEESCGYLAGDFVRDKDAVIAAALVVSMAAYHRRRGLTLAGRLEQLRRQHGFYASRLVSFPLDKGGAEEMMLALRAGLPATIGGRRVLEIRDFLAGEASAPGGDLTRPLNLPRDNTLQLLLEENHLITWRPSGTEPKVKLYLEVKEASRPAAEKALAKMEGAALALMAGGTGQGA